MKKIGLLCLATVLALGAMGVGLAKWSETLTIVGVVNTGEVDVQFSAQQSNDPSILLTGVASLDPSEFGQWDFGPLVPDINQNLPWIWNGARYDKDVASIDCTLEEIANPDDPSDGGWNLLTVTVTNGYPCYFGNIAFSIDNIGTIPVKIDALLLVEVNGMAIDPGIPLDPTMVVMVDLAGNPLVVPLSEYLDPANGYPYGYTDYVLTIHLSELDLGQQIDAVETPIAGAALGITALPGDIAVHVEQGAAEKMGDPFQMGPAYTFTVEIVASQWNEVNIGP
jgi:hypothetical protein